MSSKIFVANLSRDVDEVDLKDVFKRYGRIEDINIKEKNSKFAFVLFEDKEDAKDALREDGRNLNGKRIRVEISESRSGDRRDSRGGRDGGDDMEAVVEEETIAVEEIWTERDALIVEILDILLEIVKDLVLTVETVEEAEEAEADLSAVEMAVETEIEDKMMENAIIVEKKDTKNLNALN
eukprot:CAMPEP_0117029684 /NCGR_PEP_ID=MMETSP0472-20121206/21474_1 /TAXON_ID=693140 ORGANISM="Tiarina fusus, Strain LIS" /NCGR_SAMPLE_ID=MMETSP0472 /ASSEMBLY_ACC=CAM_ASM_000603 /LENGTH=180 /DNA_ID=CAMNT_0004737519 /DNA_START=32 /DNA_END=575 /DNA_ORIENTATION=+